MRERESSAMWSGLLIGIGGGVAFLGFLILALGAVLTGFPVSGISDTLVGITIATGSILMIVGPLIVAGFLMLWPAIMGRPRHHYN